MANVVVSTGNWWSWCRASILAVVSFSAASLTSAHAHHPGSHATRQSNGKVKVEAVTMATDTCTRIRSIRLGMPAGVSPPPGITPATIRLERGGEACATAVMPVGAEAELDMAPSAKQIILYIESPDGALLGSERVPVR
jgi:hypothetical protein